MAGELKFKILINMPNDIHKEKIIDLLKLLEVDYVISSNKKEFSV